MDIRKIKMEQSVKAMRCSAKGIAATIEDESISSDEAYCLLEVIADSFESMIGTPVEARLTT